MKSVPEDPGSRRGKPLQSGADRYEALLEVLEQQARAAHAEPARGRSSVRPVQLLLVLVLVVAAIWVWVFPPAWLVPPPPGPIPIEEEEAGLRFAMYLQAQQIRAYELARGALPPTLEAAGEPLPGMRYVVLDDGLYELTGATERVELTYRSDQPLRQWVGPGAEVLNESAVP